jgi:hypothetical protein
MLKNTFIRWYIGILFPWIALDCGVCFVVFYLLHTRLKNLELLAVAWVLPPVFAMPFIYFSYSYVTRPKLRALIFSFGALVFCLLAVIAIWYSWPPIGQTNSINREYLVPNGIVGSLFSAAAVYFISVRKLGQKHKT